MLTTRGLTRSIIWLASHIAPRRVGRTVFWRACRSTRSAPSGSVHIARAEQRLSAATRSTVVWGGHAVAVYTFAPSPSMGFRGTIALVHGWTGRAAFMTSYASALTNAGFRVVAIDLPGHGASSGEWLHLPLAVETLHAVWRETGPWHAMAGHSFGGLAAIAAAAGTVVCVPAIPIERVALIAAPPSAKTMFDYLGQAVGIGPRAQAELDAMVLEIAGRPISHFDGPTMIKTVGVRALVMHAPDDREVPFAGSVKLAAATEGLATLVPIPGAGHRRILYSPAACELLAAFMSASAVTSHGRQSDPMERPVLLH
ncbi:MAG: alpha/beta hydrolase [Hyphomicrobiaceae bacterium]|nr:alpha/beta hydrolase [Hyphomicrobiaceae bacterium]